MPRLIPCPSCGSHVFASDSRCPHCETPLRTTVAGASAVLVGLALAGCPAGDDSGSGPGPGEPDYGVPDTSASATNGMTAPDPGTTAGDTAGDTAMGMTQGDTTTGDTTMGPGSVGEPEYGVAETTGGSGSTGDSGDSGAGEPDYGVPETTN